MTIALAVASPEGTVLLTDSMTLRHSETGGVDAFLSPAGKIGVLPAAGVAFVHSGRRQADSEFPDEPAGSLQEAARRLFATLPVGELAVSPAAGSVPVGWRHGPIERARFNAQELIVAATKLGDGPRLGLVTADEGERWVGSAGGLFVAGAPALWARDRGVDTWPAPATLKAAGDLAVVIASSFIDDYYQGKKLSDFAAAGEAPPVAYPLNLLTISEEGVQTWQYEP